MEKNKQASSSSSLAARIAAWTTNLLATAVILLVAFLLGGKLLALWRSNGNAPVDDSAAAAARAFRFADDPGQPVELHFGGSQFVTHRHVVAGDHTKATKLLSNACAARLEDAEPAHGEIDSDEQRLLKYIAVQTPMLQPRLDAAVYQLPRGFPMVVGTRRVASRDAPATGRRAARQRVVVWGIAVPRRELGWTLYTFHRPTAGDPAGNGQNEPAAVDFPLPPGAQRLLAIVTPDGETITAFRGLGNPASWAEYYRRWFEADGWASTAAWRQQNSTWYARFEKRSSVDSRRVDIQLFPAKGTSAGVGAPTADSEVFQGLLSELVTPIAVGGD